MQIGRELLAEYRVLRNIADRKSVDTLAHIPALADTAFVDTALAPNTAYVYRVEVVNAAGYETPSEERSVAGFGVGVVRLLGVESDPQAGTLTLRWNRYVGPDFAGYQVRRRVGETIQEELLAVLGAVQDTVLVDTTARMNVGYVYRVVVQAAGQELSSNTYETRFLLPPVELTRADFNSADASASLAWTRYQGPRFKAYQVLRRTGELAAQVIAEKRDLADTSLVDLGLIGNTGYFYQVTVLTERGEEVKSEEKNGVFHQLLSTWPIAAEKRPFVRLYREEEGVSALVYEQGVKMNDLAQSQRLLFDAKGRLQEKQLLASAEGALINSQRSTAMASSWGGRQLLSEAVLTLGEVGILAWGADGQPLVQDLPLFGDAFPQPLTGPEAVVLGEIALLGFGGFDNVAVSAQGRLLFSEDFEDFPRRTSGRAGLLQGVVQGWDLSGGYLYSQGYLYSPGFPGGGVARRADASWQDFRLEADLLAVDTRTTLGIQIGGDTFSRLALWLDRTNQQAILDWSFVPPPELGLEPRTQRFTAPMGVLHGPTYRLGLEMASGEVRTSVRSPLLWGGRANWWPGLPWIGLATIGDILALTQYDQPYTLTQQGEATAFPSFGSGVSEIRAWQDRRGRQQVGVCLPEAGKLLLGLVPGGQEAQWPTFLIRNLGPNIGAQQDLLSYPLSFDVGPDGRIFVLDAGSSRILVFDLNRQYVTQWGRRGSGPGEFSFGEGGPALGGGLDFAGSIAVDRQGFIYVADETNKRIQKFGP